MKKIWIILAMLIGVTSNGQDSTWASAEKAYASGQFEFAVELYSNFIETHPSGEAFYNRGNAYYRKGELGRAIADWKKAKKLNPSLTDTDHNLEIARTKVVDQVEADKNPGWYEVLSSIFSGLGTNTWIIIGIACLVLSIVLTIPYVRNTSKRASLVIGAILFLIGWTFQGFAWMTHRLETQKEMVIVSDNVYVKNEPRMESNDLFVIHEGVEGDVLSIRNDWAKIRLADGKIGWVEISHLIIL